MRTHHFLWLEVPDHSREARALEIANEEQFRHGQTPVSEVVVSARMLSQRVQNP